MLTPSDLLIFSFSIFIVIIIPTKYNCALLKNKAQNNGLQTVGTAHDRGGLTSSVVWVFLRDAAVVAGGCACSYKMNEQLLD